MNHFFGVAAVVKNEAPYIEEWILFHMLQGATVFYLVDNGSTDGSYELICNLSQKHKFEVVLGRNTIRPIQFQAYTKMLEAARDHGTEWVAFLDCDEFLWSPLHVKLSMFLNLQNDNVGALAARWMLFGSGGEQERKDELVIERFTTRELRPDKHCKSIVRPSRTLTVGPNPHTFRVGVSSHIVDDRGDVLPLDYGVMPGCAADLLRINHYHVKSRAEYTERKKLGDPGTGVIHSPERVKEMFTAHDVNVIRDPLVKERYAAPINERIQGKG